MRRLSSSVGSQSEETALAYDLSDEPFLRSAGRAVVRKGQRARGGDSERKYTPRSARVGLTPEEVAEEFTRASLRCRKVL